MFLEAIRGERTDNRIGKGIPESSMNHVVYHDLTSQDSSPQVGIALVGQEVIHLTAAP